MLIGSNGLTLAKIILIIVVKGTARSIPQGPQTSPQKIRDIRIRSALRFKEEARNLG